MHRAKGSKEEDFGLETHGPTIRYWLSRMKTKKIGIVASLFGNQQKEANGYCRIDTPRSPVSADAFPSRVHRWAELPTMLAALGEVGCHETP